MEPSRCWQHTPIAPASRATEGARTLDDFTSPQGRPGDGPGPYALYDMNADQRSDLVATCACDDDDDTDHGRVHLNVCM